MKEIKSQGLHLKQSQEQEGPVMFFAACQRLHLIRKVFLVLPGCSMVIRTLSCTVRVQVSNSPQGGVGLETWVSSSLGRYFNSRILSVESRRKISSEQGNNFFFKLQ